MDPYLYLIMVRTPQDVQSSEIYQGSYQQVQQDVSARWRPGCACWAETPGGWLIYGLDSAGKPGNTSPDFDPR